MGQERFNLFICLPFLEHKNCINSGTSGTDFISSTSSASLFHILHLLEIDKSPGSFLSHFSEIESELGLSFIQIQYNRKIKMVFSGTTEKCKACEKTVHFIDMVSADGVPYHKTCFKCSHCNGLLVMSNYCSMEGVLYCKPHFEQLFKETGSYTKKFQTSGNKPNGLARAPSRLSSFFSGTQDKCSICKKTAYPLEKVSVEGELYHKSCFRCSHGGCFLTPSSYAALDGILYCKHHFAQLFKEKGSYLHLTKSASVKKNAEEPLPEQNPDNGEPEKKRDEEGVKEEEIEAGSPRPQVQA